MNVPQTFGMNDFLPSRRYGVFLVMTILIVGGVLWSSGRGKEPTPSLAYKTSSLVENTGKATSTPKFTKADPIAEPTLAERALGQEDARKGLTLTDLRLSNSESDDLLREYGLNVRDSLVSLGTASEEDELNVFVSSLKTANVEKVPVLEAAADRHDLVVLNLLKMEVPGSAAPMHLRLLRAIGHRGQLLRVMAGIESNPIDAINAADQYIAETDNILENIAEVNQYFKDKGVTFSKSEKGSVNITRYE